MVEFGDMTARFICDRGVTNENSQTQIILICSRINKVLQLLPRHVYLDLPHVDFKNKFTVYTMTK